MTLDDELRRQKVAQEEADQDLARIMKMKQAEKLRVQAEQTAIERRYGPAIGECSCWIKKYDPLSSQIELAGGGLIHDKGNSMSVHGEADLKQAGLVMAAAAKDKGWKQINVIGPADFCYHTALEALKRGIPPAAQKEASAEAHAAVQKAVAKYSKDQGHVGTIEAMSKIDPKTAQMFASHVEHYGELSGPAAEALGKVESFMMANKGQLKDGYREILKAKLDAVEDAMHPGERAKRELKQSMPPATPSKSEPKPPDVDFDRAAPSKSNAPRPTMRM